MTQAIKALRDTIEECWDHDAEARISAVCAEERTREMASLWEMRYKGKHSLVLFMILILILSSRFYFNFFIQGK